MDEWNFYSEHLYQKVSKDTALLEKNVKEYPFSSLASFLLLYHYKKTGNPGFEKLVKKTALHFSNPHWLQFILFKKYVEKEIESIEQSKVPAEVKNPDEFINNIPTEIAAVKFVTEENKEEKALVETTNGAETIENRNEVTPELYPYNSQEKIIPQQNGKAESDEVIQTDALIETILSVENKIINNTKEAIAFDPLHTVDYFASQGIKLSDEFITNDKLGGQMKSFTAWLKSMKKLHAEKLPEPNLARENLIKASSEESNINTEILTEAMAEVLIKQDKKEKAIDMFTKLSLINPAKSAYFAAKIESIKLR